jgi:hypothetical protein
MYTTRFRVPAQSGRGRLRSGCACRLGHPRHEARGAGGSDPDCAGMRQPVLRHEARREIQLNSVGFEHAGRQTPLMEVLAEEVDDDIDRPHAASLRLLTPIDGASRHDIFALPSFGHRERPANCLFLLVNGPVARPLRHFPVVGVSLSKLSGMRKSILRSRPIFSASVPFDWIGLSREERESRWIRRNERFSMASWMSRGTTRPQKLDAIAPDRVSLGGELNVCHRPLIGPH